MFLDGFQLARAAAAHMCPALYYLTGIVALAGARTSSKDFEVGAKVAREAAIDRNVGKHVFNDSVKARGPIFRILA